MDIWLRKRDWSSGCVGSRLPARQYTQIKKSFFQRGETRFDLSGGVEAFRDVFFYRQHATPPMIHENIHHYIAWHRVLLKAEGSTWYDLPTQSSTDTQHVCAPTPAYNKKNIACLLAMDGSPTAPSGVLKSSHALLAKSSTVTRLSSMASCATQKMRIDVHDSLVWRNEGARGCWGFTSMYIKGLSSSLSTACILHPGFLLIESR